VKMAEYAMAFIITDSEMKRITANTDEKQIVKRENLTTNMLNDYVPFNGAAIVGEEDFFGRIIQKIEGNKDKITVSGVTMVGVMPIPWTQDYVVGENFTAKDIFEVSEDGSAKREGFAKIEKIILSKTQNDLDGFINYCAEVNAAHGRPIMYAETNYGDYTPPAAELHKAEEESDFFGAEYEAHLVKLTQSLYPQHRMYESNV
tara:strand:- start:9152 stop:9760 length:609 start_codon:yes stop_codon:yes gene_type:complete